jgi:hypothetical protein
VADAFISNFKSHKPCILSQFTQQHCNTSPKKPHTLAALEPGPSVPQENGKKVLTTAPRRRARAISKRTFKCLYTYKALYVYKPAAVLPTRDPVATNPSATLNVSKRVTRLGEFLPLG